MKITPSLLLSPVGIPHYPTELSLIVAVLISVNVLGSGYPVKIKGHDEEVTFKKELSYSFSYF